MDTKVERRVLNEVALQGVASAGVIGFDVLAVTRPKKMEMGGAVMKKSLVAFILMVLVGGFFASVVVADDTLVQFQGAIGDIPVSNVAGTANSDGTFPAVTQNTVRLVNPAGQIWVIAKLTADVTVNGHIRVDGQGLLLGGGDAIGTNANASVFATLICQAVAPFTENSTNLAGVPLAANGDFAIDDVLTPAPPADCASPVLLIRVTDGGTWFAAGIPKLK